MPRVATEIENFSDISPAFNKFLYENPNPALGRLFEAAETKSGQKREYLAYGVLGFVGLYLILGSLAEIVCNLIGFAYPAYASVKAIRTEGKEDDTQWLIYWTVFASFSLLDFFAEKICSWFPIYWLVKTIFLIYLSAPQTRGAIKLYEKVVDPMVTKIDAQLSKYRGGGASTYSPASAEKSQRSRLSKRS